MLRSAPLIRGPWLHDDSVGPGSARQRKRAAPGDTGRFALPCAADRPSILLGRDSELENLCRAVLQVALRSAENHREQLTGALGKMRRPERKFLVMRAADHRHILLASLLFLFWRGRLGEGQNRVGCHQCRPAVPRSSREGNRTISLWLP